ncbi:MAG: ammonium transporter [Cyanothece sp. SIO1E1]|nr:ammonium transporter [Cyanothece sp. SIO1E1]
MLDTLWLLLCTGLVFLMQAGFMCLESGLTRSKNSINVAVKNMADFGLSVALFWVFGYAIMFGASQAGWIGRTGFFPSAGSEPQGAVFFLYQAMFCGTATTIISGAVAERLKFTAYLLIAGLASGLIYPLLGHWAWNGIAGDNAGGWLENLGFVDFAGSTVVHSVGAWISLATLIIVGARQGRFSAQGSAHKIQGSDMPFSVLGALLLWFGWIGFNGGSTLALNQQVPGIILNTVLAGVAGMMTAAVLSWLRHQRLEVEFLINGSIAGLVAITACCHVVTTPLAVIVGGTGAAIAILVSYWLTRWQIDDAVDAVAIHGGAGVWGTLSVALFGQLSLVGTDLSRSNQLLVQLLGVAVGLAWAFGLSWIILTLVNRVFPLRVSAEDEALGLNVSEHRAKTDTYDLFEVMDHQAKTFDLSLRVPVEPFTEVGHIATRYNQVIDSLERNHHQNTESLEQLYYITAALTAAVENNNFQPETLDLDESIERTDDLGTLARMVQEMVHIVNAREQALAEVKGRLQHSEQRVMRGAIAEVLKTRFGLLPKEVIDGLESIADGELLNVLLREAIAVEYLDDFQQTLTQHLVNQVLDG